MVWIARLAMTALVAAIMAVIGYHLMFKDGAERWSLDESSFYCVIPSILLWLALAFVLYRQTYITAVGWGLLSPLIGSLFIAGLAGPLIALLMWHVTFPVGIVTGILVKLCVSLGSEPPNGRRP